MSQNNDISKLQKAIKWIEKKNDVIESVIIDLTDFESQIKAIRNNGTTKYHLFFKQIKDQPEKYLFRITSQGSIQLNNLSELFLFIFLYFSNKNSVSKSHFFL